MEFPSCCKDAPLPMTHRVSSFCSYKCKIIRIASHLLNSLMVSTINRLLVTAKLARHSEGEISVLLDYFIGHHYQTRSL